MLIHVVDKIVKYCVALSYILCYHLALTWCSEEERSGVDAGVSSSSMVCCSAGQGHVVSFKVR